MTASEPLRGGGERSLADRALDLVLYAPAGAVLSALEDLPAMAEKGRARIDRELRNARVVGRFAIDFGLRQVKEQLDWLAAEGRKASPAERTTRPATGGPATAVPPRATTAPRPAAKHTERPERPARPSARTAAPRSERPPQGAPAARDATVDRAIRAYDTLSASQVVRRLDGLSEADLRAVVRHETANRGRRTILHRAEQLLGSAGSDARAGRPDARDGTEPPGA